MDQLRGAKRLLRASEAQYKRARNHATLSALANPYPNLPDSLTLKTSNKSRCADDWCKVAPPRDRLGFESEIYGPFRAYIPRM